MIEHESLHLFKAFKYTGLTILTFGSIYSLFFTYTNYKPIQKYMDFLENNRDLFIVNTQDQFDFMEKKKKKIKLEQ